MSETTELLHSARVGGLGGFLQPHRSIQYCRHTSNGIVADGTDMWSILEVSAMRRVQVMKAAREYLRKQDVRLAQVL